MPELDIDLGTASSSPPVASFTANPTSGNAPLAVTFADTSTGGPTSWQWDFGDGTGLDGPVPAGSQPTRPPGATPRRSSPRTPNGPSVAGDADDQRRDRPCHHLRPRLRPPSGSAIKTMTFEGSVADRPGDRRGLRSPGASSARRPTRSRGSSARSVSPTSRSAYLNETFTAAPDAYVALDLRLTALPSGTTRFVFFSDQGTTVGNIQVLSNGRLRLRNVSTTVGADFDSAAARDRLPGRPAPAPRDRLERGPRGVPRPGRHGVRGAVRVAGDRDLDDVGRSAPVRRHERVGDRRDRRQHRPRRGRHAGAGNRICSPARRSSRRRPGPSR